MKRILRLPALLVVLGLIVGGIAVFIIEAIDATLIALGFK